MSIFDKQRKELYQREKARLEKQYPQDDAWRAPRNIADSMGCVGYAMFALEQYQSMLDGLSDHKIALLYHRLHFEDLLKRCFGK